MIELMKQWLEALEQISDWYCYDRSVGELASNMYEASCLAKVQAKSLRQAIAEAEKQEPVAYIRDVIEGLNENGDPISVEAAELIEKLYFHPQPKSEWVGLTDGELDRLYATHHDKFGQTISASQNGWSYERAIEARLKEKNNG